MHIRLFVFFFLLILLAVIHTFASTFFLYWKYLWMDIPMHFLGGMVIALGISILPFFKVFFLENRNSPYMTMAVVLLIGILWEVFELSVGIPREREGFWTDTLLDLLMDICGGLAGYFVVTRITKA